MQIHYGKIEETLFNSQIIHTNKQKIRQNSQKASWDLYNYSKTKVGCLKMLIFTCLTAKNHAIANVFQLC